MGGPVKGRESFLGVERSLGGKRWVARLADERAALALAQRAAVPEAVGRVLAARGVGLSDAEGFLDPTLRRAFPDPSHLKDMDAGADRLAGAVMQGERIAIFGDYDVDGATSAALLRRFLDAVGARSAVYIPDRLREGYGPNAEALLKLKEGGASVVVTVDCGTAAHEALAVAADAGLEVIVVDHHVAEARLPRAAAVINPNRLDEESPHRQLAAVGVAFLLCVALNRALRQAGWYAARPEPDPLAWLDLVALGTVCDVAPLTGLNRVLVAQGLKVMGQRRNPGLSALADVAGMDQAPGAYQAGFVLGPRINAGGRVGEANLGVRLLTTEEEGEARDIAERLDDLNRERQAIEAGVLNEALALLEAGAHRGATADSAEAADAALVFAAAEGWHPGVIGIVASRLKERFNRPAFVVALEGAVATGSGRSVSGVDLGSVVIAARQAGLVVKAGGHAMAAGFTAPVERLENLRVFIAERVALSLAEVDTVPSLGLDGALQPAAATDELIAALGRLEPFGVGNAEPRFAIPSARLAYTRVVGGDQNHLRCTLAGADGRRLAAIAFSCMDKNLGQALARHDGAPFHIAGRLRENVWQGRSSPQLLIDDAAPAW
ncbi:MAG: single-stranded-DNA-specific exonuclease RecJ [Rhodospirillales bacterium]|nr:single-stranded-DNA-specific exonuclease RecJ [Rhodospirillales bacterium]HJO73325.1 single-stranded-DNA-specific exonuclease RecJ [Rhodospirillales bacterium]